MSSGSSARKLANTSARMTSAPTAPIIASAISPVPLAEAAAVGQQLRAGDPDVPAGRRGRGHGALRSPGRGSGRRSRLTGAVYTSAKVDRPSRVTNAGLCVVA